MITGWDEKLKRGEYRRTGESKREDATQETEILQKEFVV